MSHHRVELGQRNGEGQRGQPADVILTQSLHVGVLGGQLLASSPDRRRQSSGEHGARQRDEPWLPWQAEDRDVRLRTLASS